jgi:AmiR/NasT family two-component response regulator
MIDKPKSYLALDWDDIVELENSAIEQMQTNNQSVAKLNEAKTILMVIEWMKENNAYEKNYK